MVDPVLPREVLHLVFCHLSPDHLKAALLVCRCWREVGEAPGLWKNINLRITRKDFGLIPEVLAARRMLAVREITLEEKKEEEVEEAKEAKEVEDVEEAKEAKEVYEEVAEVEEVLLAICRHRGMTRLNLAGTDLRSVDHGLLARLVHRLKRLDVTAAKLTSQQIEAILVALGHTTTGYRLQAVRYWILMTPYCSTLLNQRLWIGSTLHSALH